MEYYRLFHHGLRLAWISEASSGLFRSDPLILSVIQAKAIGAARFKMQPKAKQECINQRNHLGSSNCYNRHGMTNEILKYRKLNNQKASFMQAKRTMSKQHYVYSRSVNSSISNGSSGYKMCYLA